MPDPAALERLTALETALRAAGYLGDDPAPIVCGSYSDTAPRYTPVWRAGAVPAAQALIDGWDWTPKSTTTLTREAATALFNAAGDRIAAALRAVILTALDEINTLRQRDRDRSADVAAATSLADLKTRWAARAALADRTAAQAKQAVADKITGGGAD